MTTFLLVVALSIAAGYAMLCAAAPTVPCRRCRGAGQVSRLMARRLSECPACAGSGRRRRAGAR